MNSSGKILRRSGYSGIATLLFACALSLLGGNEARAAQISFVSASGNWHDPVDSVPGNQQGQPVITNGVPTSRINWGVTNGSQSGYDFSRTIPGTQTLPPAPTPFFPLGTFTHRNFPVSGPSLTSVQLDVVLVLNVDGVQTPPLNFTFTFNHVETPNNPTPPATCPYPTPAGEGCTDRVTFVSAPRPTTFNVGGVDYTLSMSFVDPNGNPVAEFITREGLVNTANLVGQFTLPPINDPVLTVSKSGPATMTMGQPGDFTIDVQNTGVGDAWNAAMRDQLPRNATGGMCETTPAILSARVFAADGVTPVSGKGALNQGSDYSLSYSAAPNCRLDITILTAAGRIGPNERLIVRYRTQLDANTQGGVTLTNVAGAIQWFNAASGNPSRMSFNRTLTNGTPGFLDHEDAFTVGSDSVPSTFLVQKISTDLTGDPNVLLPGETLRYTITVRNTGSSNASNVTLRDSAPANTIYVAGSTRLNGAPVADVAGQSALVNGMPLNSLPAGTTATITFDVIVSQNVANGTVILNQGYVSGNGVTDQPSDDPDTPAPNDPTRDTVAGASTFLVQKISTDLTGDPNLLLPGETLRYTITVRNNGSSNASNVTLRDPAPANTIYVAGSTRLNGATVADVAGQSPIVNGMPLNSLPAGTTATITFDVIVSQNVVNGTVILNQGYVSGTGVTDQPSDDPDTPAPNDPTRDIVGGASSLLVQKISTDLSGDPNLLLTGETLRYTITVRNTGSNDATNVTLRDAVPANTTYVAGSTRLNGAAVADAAGQSPLVSGMPLNSVPAGTTSTITFDVRVNANVAGGTVISNQGFVTASGITDQPSDDPDTPAPNDPTRDTVAGSSAFLVQKISNDLTGDPNVLLAGETLHYTIWVRNTGSSNATNVTLRDAVPANTTYITGSTQLNGAAVADAAGQSPLPNGMPINSLPSGSTATITFDVVVNSNAATGTVISNQGFVTASGIGIVDQPSDDPDTPAPNDPTRDTVGTQPSTFLVQKISNDLTGDPNVLLAGETLHYTIWVRNTGSSNAANVTLRDAVPANTTYVAGSTQLNGAAVADAAGVSPLVNGMPLNTLPAGTTATINFDVVVNPNAVTGTVISNQGFVTASGIGIVDQPSDDPDTPAANDPTRDIVAGQVSTSSFLVQKTSTDLTGDPNLLLAGETLRYTITVRNTGSSNAANVTLRDAVPANTTYVTGSTRLNGAVVADAAGQSPLVTGMPINALPAGTTATITFDVVVNPNVATGTVISNQGFVTGNGVTDQPSDDPDTPVPNDPTRDVVGAQASTSSFLVQKISTDLTGDPNLLLAGETLRYTITVRNTGSSNAANVTLRDVVPANTAYVAGSTRLNGAVVGDAAGQSPLVTGMPINALPAGTTATITFDVVVNPNVANGTVISNQGFVTGNGITDQPSDDPDTPTPNDPTRDIVGVVASTSSFLVQKTSTDLTGDPNLLLAGETLRYTITIRNNGSSNAANVMLRDAVPANTTYVAGSTRLNGAAVADAAGQSPIVSGMPINALPAGTTATITFDVVVNPNVANGTVISNQGFVSGNGITDQPSDDPDTPAPNDPTRDIVGVVASTSSFLVQKTSTDLTGDPNLLLAGETLRYTITIRNNGSSNATNVTLRDAVPANTTYVAGSTRLNGAAVADSAGQSPIVSGMPINALPAGTTATITFDVVVNPNVANGTVISNQGFVSGNGITDQPSDDPDTPASNDPTIDLVGNRPSLYADKRVTLFGDRRSPGIVDPDDLLRYTITVRNSAAVPATGVVLTDSVPANTTYVANSTLLNGSPVSQPDNGVSPLASGVNMSSSGQITGTIAAGATAVLQFDLRVNSGTPGGTQIRNQAVVTSTGLPNLLTDGDGNPATGPEPTVVVVGAAQGVEISNQVSVVGGGSAVPGAQLDYIVRVTNTGSVPALNVVITDDLNASQPGQLAYVNQSATINGVAAGVSINSSTINVQYGAVYGPLAPSAVAELRFRARLNGNLALGTVVTNTGVVTWNDPAETASSSVSIVVGSVPGAGTSTPAVLTGAVWHDANFDEARDSGERLLAGWSVELYRDNQRLQSVVTDANGAYTISDVEPNDGTSVRYELRFHAPGAGTTTAMLGRAASQFTNGLQRISGIIVPSGANLQGLNLPIHPNGVIYNSIERIPVAGATLVLQDARTGSPLPASCFDDAAQQGQITLADGYYKFDMNFSDPSCPSGGDYLIGVDAPAGTNYVAGYSQIIPPASNASTSAFSVPACPSGVADAIPGTAMFCEVQPSASAPPASIARRSAGTAYHVHLMLDSSQMPGTSQIFNNHIALDPLITGTLSISITTPLLSVSRGQLVPYVITVNNSAGQMATNVTIVDRLPAGFAYVPGSALLDGVPAEPSLAGRELSWSDLQIAGTEARTLRLLVAAGAGISEGEFVSRAWLVNRATGIVITGEATATVRLVPDLTMDCTDATGKVFNDANHNGRQDNGEEGLAGVRVVTPRGLFAMTDQYGRYHITCAVTPNESRGSNFVLKLDDRTLPSGFRMSTDQVQIQRATRGRVLRINFGASIERVVSIDLLDAAFEPGKAEIREQWKPRIKLLLEELRKAPAMLRLSYVADIEDEALVKQRMEALKRQLTESWRAEKYSYALTIEPEIFWRRGAPPKRPSVRLPGSK